MRYIFAAGGALLVASNSRLIAGKAAGVCTLLFVLLYSLATDRKPALFFLLALSVWAAVRYGLSYCLIAAIALVFLRQQHGDSTIASMAGSVSLVWLIIGLRERHRIVVLITAAPLLFFLVLAFTRQSAVPVIGLFLANVITLISLAYRGWVNKRLLD